MDDRLLNDIREELSDLRDSGVTEALKVGHNINKAVSQLDETKVRKYIDALSEAEKRAYRLFKAIDAVNYFRPDAVLKYYKSIQDEQKKTHEAEMKRLNKEQQKMVESAEKKAEAQRKARVKYLNAEQKVKEKIAKEEERIARQDKIRQENREIQDRRHKEKLEERKSELATRLDALKTQDINKKVRQDARIEDKQKRHAENLSLKREQFEYRKARDAEKDAKREAEKLKREQEAVNSRYAQAITNSFINIPKGADKVLGSSMKELTKIAPDIANAFMGTSAGQSLAGTEAFKAMSGAMGVLTKAGPLIAAITVALTAMTAAGAKANETTLNITRSLRQLSSDFNDMGLDAIETSNKMAVVKNRFREMGYELLQAFEPIYEGFVNFLYAFTRDIPNYDGNSRASINGKENDLDSEINALKEIGLEITTEQIAGIVADISKKAQQAGFDTDSANKMGLRTLAEAQNLATYYGKAGQVGEVANQLANAWLSGSDSAREYGIVTNDETLYGWMAQEKGIDGVNTKLSDAAMMAYRFELAMYSAGQTGTESLQDQIKGWREYGTEIKAAQNQLLSFEQVVTLKAVNPSIPTMDYDGIVDTVNKSEKNKVNVDLEDTEFRNGIYSIIGLLDQLPHEVRIKLGIDSALSNIKTINNFQQLTGLSFDNNIAQTVGNGISAYGSALLGTPNMSGWSSSLGNLSTINSFQPTSTSKSITDYINTNKTSNSELNKIESGIIKAGQWLEDSGWNDRFRAFNDKMFGDGGKGIANLALGLFGGILTGGASMQAISGSVFPGGVLPITGHYDGGISTRAHIARISEFNSEEAIIPLNNPSANPAFDRMADRLADRMIGGGTGGNTANTYNLAPGGVVIADNYSVDRFVEMIANKLATLNRDRGDMSYGIR